MSRPSLARAAIPLALLAGLGGCELLVDGKLHDVHCADEGAFGPPACPEGDVCTRGMCVPSALGALCVADADCAAPDFCLDPAVFGGAGAPRCSRPCCESSDCDPDARFVCWVAPDGVGGFCRAASDVGRTGGGAGRAGASCDGGAACRSGLCAAGRCADTCCSDTGCAATGDACRYGSGPALEAAGFWCMEPATGKKGRYDACEQDVDCASGLCLAIEPDPTRRCTVPCCDSAACEVAPGKGTPVACAPVLVGGVWARACSLLVAGQATLAVGAGCQTDGDCRSGACGRDKRCSDACCTDASCGDPSSFVCRPVDEAASWALRCTAK
jgi:hypothetical protein